MTDKTAGASISARFVRFVRQRPPSAALVVDIDARNDSESARWLLVPLQLPLDEGGVFAVETLKTTSKDSTVFARLLGRGGRAAFQIEAGAKLSLQNLAITWWGAEPGRFELPVEFAAEVSIEGKALGDWMTEKPSPAAVGRKLQVDVGAARLTGSAATNERQSLPVELKEATAVVAMVVTER